MGKELLTDIWHTYLSVYKIENCFLGSPNHPEHALRWPKKNSKIFFFWPRLAGKPVCSELSGSQLFSGMQADRRKLASGCCRLHSFLLSGNHFNDVIIIILQKLSWTSLSEWQRYLDTVSYKTIQKQPKVILHILFPDYVRFKFGNCVSKDLCYLLSFSPLRHLALLIFYVISCLNFILNFLIHKL